MVFVQFCAVFVKSWKSLVNDLSKNTFISLVDLLCCYATLCLLHLAALHNGQAFLTLWSGTPQCIEHTYTHPSGQIPVWTLALWKRKRLYRSWELLQNDRYLACLTCGVYLLEIWCWCPSSKYREIPDSEIQQTRLLIRIGDISPLTDVQP